MDKKEALEHMWVLRDQAFKPDILVSSLALRYVIDDLIELEDALEKVRGIRHSLESMLPPKEEEKK